MEFGRSSSGAQKARWLAELALAVEQAEQAANRLGLTASHSEEARELRARIAAAKREIEDLRLGGWRAPSRELGSKWIKLGGY